ncbi:MAG: alpha/beta hydrolase [Terrimicrobiaceae bacterium]|nr:alpha/beta hydrolase [Terrimicrobiaceae bacterium]
MAYFTTSDSTRLFYKDWGSGQPILFSHGWPLSSDAWDQQLLFFGQNNYRVIAHDRRSHGRSDQTWDGNHMNQYADDLKELIEALDLRELILVGHSTGGGEVAHYLGRHGTSRVAKVVLVGAVPPLMLRTDANPHGTPRSVFDTIRENTAKNRSQFFHDLAIPFYGFNRDGVETNQGIRENFRRIGLQGGIKGQYDCIREFSEVDYTDDLRRINCPTLVVHGDDDQIVPIDASARLAVKLLPNANLNVYVGGSHGLTETEADRFNLDILKFIRS